MSRHYSYTQTNSRTCAIKTRKLALGYMRGETWTLLLGSLLLAFSAAYIVLTNMSAASTFKLNDQRKKVEELSLKNKKIENELANQESISRLEEEARLMGLVPIGRVKYIETPGDVAVK